MTVEVSLLPASVAGDAALIAELCGLVNAAYANAEEGRWFRGKERIGRERLAEIAAAGELAVARRGERIVGTVRVRRVDPETGYFGVLAVEPAARGAGVGGELVRFAEELSRERGAARMELRLLVPRDGADPGRHRLYTWYSRLGYEVVDRADFGETHPDLVVALRTPLDVLTMRKRL